MSNEFASSREHLTRDREASHSMNLNNGNEAYCRRCGARVTLSPTGTEFGHVHGCPQRPGDLSDRGPTAGGEVAQLERRGVDV